MPTRVYRRSIKPAEVRFWERVAKTDTCWLWTGCTQTGYGRFWDGERYVLAHRYSWQLHGGAQPAQGWSTPAVTALGRRFATHAGCQSASTPSICRGTHLELAGPRRRRQPRRDAPKPSLQEIWVTTASAVVGLAQSAFREFSIAGYLGPTASTLNQTLVVNGSFCRWPWGGVARRDGAAAGTGRPVPGLAASRVATRPAEPGRFGGGGRPGEISSGLALW